MEVGRWGYFSELVLHMNVRASAVGLDDRNAFGDACRVCGVFLVFGGNVFTRKGECLSDCGRSVAVGVANGVEEAIVLASVVLAGPIVDRLLFRVTLGGSSVSASVDVLREELFGFIGVVI